MDNKNLVYHVNKKKEEKFYLQIHVKTSQKPIYLWGDREISVEELNGYLQKKSAPKTQDALDKKVILRDIELSNIKRIKMLGETYRVGEITDPEIESVKERIDKYEEPSTRQREETHVERGIRELLIETNLAEAIGLSTED